MRPKRNLTPGEQMRHPTLRPLLEVIRICVARKGHGPTILEVCSYGGWWGEPTQALLLEARANGYIHRGTDGRYSLPVCKTWTMTEAERAQYPQARPKEEADLMRLASRTRVANMGSSYLIDKDTEQREILRVLDNKRLKLPEAGD